MLCEQCPYKDNVNIAIHHMFSLCRSSVHIWDGQTTILLQTKQNRTWMNMLGSVSLPPKKTVVSLHFAIEGFLSASAHALGQ